MGLAINRQRSWHRGYFPNPYMPVSSGCSPWLREKGINKGIPVVFHRSPNTCLTGRTPGALRSASAQDLRASWVVRELLEGGIGGLFSQASEGTMAPLAVRMS